MAAARWPGQLPPHPSLPVTKTSFPVAGTLELGRADPTALSQFWGRPTQELHLPSINSHVYATYHDRPVAHIQLGLPGDQGLLVLLSHRGDPVEDVQVLGAGKAGEERAPDQ